MMNFPSWGEIDFEITQNWVSSKSDLKFLRTSNVLSLITSKSKKARLKLFSKSLIELKFLKLPINSVAEIESENFFLISLFDEIRQTLFSDNDIEKLKV